MFRGNDGTTHNLFGGCGENVTGAHRRGVGGWVIDGKSIVRDGETSVFINLWQQRHGQAHKTQECGRVFGVLADSDSQFPRVRTDPDATSLFQSHLCPEHSLTLSVVIEQGFRTDVVVVGLLLVGLYHMVVAPVPSHETRLYTLRVACFVSQE